jgi:hypothetical protein
MGWGEEGRLRTEQQQPDFSERAWVGVIPIVQREN